MPGMEGQVPADPGEARNAVLNLMRQQDVHLTPGQKLAVELVMAGHTIHSAARLSGHDRSNFRRMLRKAAGKLAGRWTLGGPPPPLV